MSYLNYLNYLRGGGGGGGGGFIRIQRYYRGTQGAIRELLVRERERESFESLERERERERELYLSYLRERDRERALLGTTVH